MVRITIEIDGKDVLSTTVQPTSSVAAAPPQVAAHAAALGALDAGSAPSGIASISAALAAPAAIAPPEVLARAAALGALDAGSAPSGIAGVSAAFGGTPAAIDAGASPEHAASSKYAGDAKEKSKQK